MQNINIELDDETIRCLALLGEPTEVVAHLARSAAESARGSGQPQRAQTDESLRFERGKADTAVAEKREAEEKEADEVLRLARERADQVVASTQANAVQEHRTNAPAIEAQARVLLEHERSDADAVLEDERAERRRESAFLATEREATDQDLIAERTEADMAKERAEKGERELGVSNRELEQVAFAASHDLKAPLRGIAIVCDWIEEDLAAVMTEDLRKHLDMLRTRVGRMGAIVDGILEFARVGQLRAGAETVDVGALIRDVVDLLPIPDGAIVEIAPGIPSARVQRQLLEQVFSNLIGNALKYTRRADARVGVGFAKKDDFLEFWVTDNGPGIALEHQDRIWSLFQRLESQDDIEGTGIGLALVKKIVEAQRGRVWIISQPGHGATFRFLWPVAPILA